MPDLNNLPPMRGPVLATHGMVCSEHPLATQTGVDVLRRGGNAFDAALAMSALLPVVKPHRNHLGGDAYILVYPQDEGRVTAICSGGKAPLAAEPDRYAGDSMPRHGGGAAAVPGLVDAWDVVRRWCSMSMQDLLAPATRYAHDGFPVSRELGLSFQTAQRLFAKYPSMAETLYVDGRPPVYGQIWRQPRLADTLDAIATDGRRALYDGAAADHIAAAVQESGGFMTASDLATHAADVLDPLEISYRDDVVYETPPNSQGLILLEQLKILEGYDVAKWPHLSADATHHMVEAKKIAFEDRQRFAGDPSFVDFDPRTLLTAEWAASRRNEIDPSRARSSSIPTVSTDTTSFVVVDASGNACSFIQSLYANWGSAVGVPELGIVLNNRMSGFSLDAAHPNVLAGGKRTMHTLNTYLVFRNGRPYIIGNTPGGDFQVQTNLQVLTAILDYGLDPQAAIDAPRWGDSDRGLIVEEEMPLETQQELAARGHRVVQASRVTAPMGRAQVISVDPDTGVFVGGSDSRGEGATAGW